MNKHGFTLMELMVYMAMIGIVVIVAGRAFSNSTKVRVESESLIKANHESETLGSLLRDDIAQMGTKSTVDSTKAGELRSGLEIKEEVYMDAANGDSSSFNYFRAKEDPNAAEKKLITDTLVMRRVQYDSDGKFKRVEEITWFVNNDSVLNRSCKSLTESDDPACPEGKAFPVEIARKISKFEITPSTPELKGGPKTLFPVNEDKRFRLISRSDPIFNVVDVSISPSGEAKSFGISGFNSNFREDDQPVTSPVSHQVFVGNAGETGSSYVDCKRFNFLKDKTYEFTFKTPYSADDSRMFKSGKDHFSVGCRVVKDNEVSPCNGIHDVLIFPPQSKRSPDSHKMQFTPTSDVNSACLAFTMAFFSPTVGSGRFYIANLELREVANGNYAFDHDYELKTEDKANVRAFKVDLEMKRNGVAGQTLVVVPVPSNGPAAK